MIPCEKLRILSYFCILILALTLSAKGKPRIEGSEIIVSYLGQNISIECWGNRSVTWVKYVNKTGKPNIINEESHIQHIESEERRYIDWADPHETPTKEFLAVLQIETAQIEDSGLYVCTYESDFETILKRVKKNKSDYFDTVQLNVKLMKPRIDVGQSMILNAGDNFNLTCSGDRPVTWVLTNNHTWGIQHTESESENQTIFLSVLEIENVNFTDVGYFVCTFSDTSSNVYEDFNDFVHDEEMNIAATYVFVKDINHLIVQQDTNEFTALLSEKVIIPCKPTFPEVKISLVALDGSMEEKKKFHYPHSIHTGSLLIGETASTTKLMCTARFLERVESVYFTVTYYNPILSSVNLTVEGSWQMNSLERRIHTYDVVEGEVLMINCSTQYKKNIARIMWQTPPSANERKRHVLRVRDYEDKTVETRIFPKVSLKKDSGIYSCYVTNNHVNSSSFRFALNVYSQKSSHLLMKAQNKNIYLTQEALFPEPLKWIIYFRAYPALYLNWTINGEPIVIYKIENNQIDHFKSMIKRKEQYEIKVNWFDGEITLIIHSPTIKDTGTYVLSAEVPHKSNNPIKQNITLKFFKKGVPQVVNSVIKPLTRAKLLGTKFTIECSAFGFPFPDLKAYFKPCSSRRNCHAQQFSEISNKDIRYNDETIDAIDSNSEITGKRSIRWKGRAKVQGYYICNAKNDYGSQNSSENLLIISDSGFKNSDFLQIEVRKNEESFVPSFEVSLIEGDDVTITCRGNTFMTSQPLIWTVMTGENSSILFGNKNFSFHEINVSVYENQTELSYISQIMGKASKEMDGMVIKCKDGSITSFEKAVNVTVIDARPPQWIGETLMKRHLILSENEKLNLSCSASGTPSPSVVWYKDDSKLELDESDRRISILEGNLSFEFLFSEDSGKYLCKVTNREGSIEDFVTLEVKDPDAVPQKVLISSIAVFAAISLIVVIILGIKVYKDKKAERSFKLEIQKRFIEGNPESLNPDLDLGEQADLLPYDNKFEFPRDRVTIENLLGSGAFGNVFKATARDLISGVTKTTVAVKMLKSPTNPALMKTLVSELKIMIHIGRHINIVNLLGACSKNMASKGELLLLVEYCRYGNILEYMRRQRTEFLNQININDKIDPSSKYFRRRTNSNSRNSLRTTYAQLDLQRNSNYFANNTDASHDSEHSGRSFIESGATIDTAERRRIKSDSASNDTITNTDMTTDTIGNSANNYISESVFEQRGPLCSEDLLHWSYQIANGMFYLSEKKVIHGDLAARNILLADKNVVKISDFGLSKNIYKQDNYKKKSECPLPVKWLALEALRDSIFSTHSDVWSYGVVLWEIFSLGSNPYAGVEVDAEFVNKLEKGLRLSHPQYATAELYQIMKRCWNENPNSRPSFRQLEKILGDMLGEAEKQMYITLNAHYEENNYISEHLKYLNTPSYDSRVRNFFTEKDEDGYEKALPSPMAPENGVIIENHQKFQLHPVPKKKNLATQGTKEEMEMLLDSSPPTTEYLVMKSPTDKEKPIEMETFSVNNTMYANLRHLNSLNISDAQRKSVPSSESHNEESNSFDPKEDKIFTFSEISSMENDSVFDPDVLDDTYCKNDLPRFIKNGYYENKLNSVSSYNHKHDSGIYSPNLIQNNPIYIQKNNAMNESENTIKINANDSSFKTPYCIGKKQRNQSDSSSGIGSLDDRHNSLEKQRNELEKLQTERSILEIQKPLQQTV